jgi:hypothetical protein
MSLASIGAGPFDALILMVLFLLSAPVVGNVALVPRAGNRPDHRRRCPSCGGWTGDGTTTCLSCGSVVQPTRPVVQQSSIWDCACGAGNPITHSTCWRCGGPSPPRIVLDAAADPDSDTR